MQQASISVEATKQMSAFCFETLSCKLKKQKLPPHPEHFNHITCPIFVTWLMEGELRGCIGTFSPEPLSKILGKYALISALKDDRFSPITADELPKLTACVSLLVDFKKDKDPLDWQIGRHGIILHLNRNGRKYQATYLPEVAAEWEWTKEQTLKSLLEKSGYHGPYNLVKETIRITTYESSKVELNYAQYQSIKVSLVNGANGVKPAEQKTNLKEKERKKVKRKLRRRTEQYNMSIDWYA